MGIGETLSDSILYDAGVAVEASNVLGSHLAPVAPCRRDSSRRASHGARALCCWGQV